MRKDKAILRLLSNPRVIAFHYSPSISRTIPGTVSLPQVRFMNEWLVIGFVSGLLLYMIINLGLRISVQTQELAAKQQMTETITREIAHWQKVTTDYPQYRDAYFRLALLQYQLGNVQLAEMNGEKAVAIDPNFTQGRAFLEKLHKE